MAKKKMKKKSVKRTVKATTTTEKKIPVNPVEAGGNFATNIAKKFNWGW